MRERESDAVRGPARRRGRLAAGLLALAVSTAAGGAHGASPQQVYDRMLAKIPRISDAAVGRFKPRHVCACLTRVTPFAGVVMYDDFDNVRCVKVGFTPEGKPFSFFLCDDFTVLGR